MELQNAANASLRIAITISALLCFVATCIPICAGVAIRFNFRFGIWRKNIKAYVATINMTAMAKYPGVQLGVVVIVYNIVLGMLTVGLIFITYKPSRDYVWYNYRGLFLTLIVSYAFVFFISFVVFEMVLAKGMKVGKNFGVGIHVQSICFSMLMFLYSVLGLFSAFTRLIILMVFSFLAIFRVDDTMLPRIVASMDVAYVSFATTMFYEHQCKNRILRCAVECLAGSRMESNGKLMRFSQDYDTTDLPNNGGQLSDIASVSGDGNSRRRAINRWHLAYTLVKNPSLVQYRRHELITIVTGEQAAKEEVREAASEQPKSSQIEAQQQVSELLADNARNMEELERVRSELSAHKTRNMEELERMELELSAKEAANKQLESSLLEAQKHMSELIADKTRNMEELERMESELSAKEAANKQLESSRLEAQQQVSELSADKARNSEELERLRYLLHMLSAKEGTHDGVQHQLSESQE